MIKKITLLLISAMMLSSMTIADEVKVSDVEAEYTNNKKVEAVSELKQSINFGFANTTGNTDTLNLNGKYTMTFTTVGYNDQALKVAFDASAFVTKNDGTKDNEEYTANLGLEQNILDGWFGYTSLNWLRNKFTNYDNKLVLGAGIGKEIFNDGKHSLKAKLGVAYNIENYSNDQDGRKFASLNEYLEYNNKLNATSSLYVKLGAMQNFKRFSEDYEFLVVAGLNFDVAENLSVTIEEEIRYDALPPVGFNETDTKTIIRVGYKF